MKLIIVLSVIACGYAAKLDRAYLPPSNAATAGGSPGALTAPGSNTGFGQALPDVSARPTGSRPSSYGQSGISNIPSGTGNIQGSGFGQASEGFPGTSSSGFNSNIGAPSQAGFQNANNAPSAQGFGQGSDNFGLKPQSSGTPFGQSPQSNAQGFAQAEFKPERAQAAADRNAEILKYINENNGDSYEYSYETSNGIAAGESGVATDGVRAQGGYSYTGDDGKSYSVTYTADENGYQPQGEHLPTPHPIPEEILKSIEENARAAASGKQEGAYRPEEYESDSSPLQYSNGASKYNAAQRPGSSLQDQGSPGLPIQGSFNGNEFNRDKPGQVPAQFSGAKIQQGSNQYSQGVGNTNKDTYPEPSSQFKQSQPSSLGSKKIFGAPQGQFNSQNGNGYNYNRPGTQGVNQLQQSQPQNLAQGFGSANNGLSGQQVGQPAGQFNQQQRPNQYTSGQNGQGQNANGYNYDRPQNPSQGSNQFSGQINTQRQPQKSTPSFGTGNKGVFGEPTSQSVNQLNQQQKPFQTSQNQFGNQQRPQKYSQGQNGQSQEENGYNYNQPQNSAQGSRFPGSGSQQSTNKGAFGQQSGQPIRESNQSQRPSQGSNTIFGKQQEPSNQISQGQRGQEQRGNGYNYNQPQNLPQGSNQSPGIGTQTGRPQNLSQMGSNDKIFSSGVQASQPVNQFGQPQRPVQGTSYSGLGNQQRPSSQFSSSQKGQDQDENGYYYNRPQITQAQGPFDQNRPQSGAQSQSGLRPTSNYDSNNNFNNQGLKPGQQAANQPSFSQARPGSTDEGNINEPASPGQGTQYSSEVNKPSFGSPNSRPGNNGNIGSRPSEQYQPSLAPASPFRPQQITSQNKPSSSSFGSPSQSQNAPGQTLAQGYQYSSPGQSTNQRRPGFNFISNQEFNGATGASRRPAGSEFEGPRQPPSFSPEEGYKY